MQRIKPHVGISQQQSETPCCTASFTTNQPVGEMAVFFPWQAVSYHVGLIRGVAHYYPAVN